jgi:peptide/nickel transport system ATP-binding protein
MLAVNNLFKSFVMRHNLLSRFSHPDHVIQAVAGVTLNVEKGEVFGIVGKSGSGKTTLARSILRLVEPDRGQIRYKGQDVLSMNTSLLKRYRKEVQAIFQDADSFLDPRQRLFSALEEPLLIHKQGSRQERREKVQQAFKHVNLPYSLVERYPSELSGGQRKRVALARALVLDPDLIIADEPTTGLDPLVGAQILRLLFRLNREYGLTLVLISHDLAAVNYLSHRIAVMYSGRIVEQINGELFEGGSRHPYTRFLQGNTAGINEEDDPVDVHGHNIVSGACVYSHACPFAKPVCLNTSPDLRQLSPGHLVACHLV